MAEYSLSKIFAKKRKIRIFTVLASLILITLLGSNLISKHPVGVKAAWDSVNCSLTGGATFTLSDASCDGKDVTISGAGSVLTLAGTHTFRSLTITNNGTLTHGALEPITDFDMTSSVLTASGNAKKIDIVLSNDLTLQSGGSINVDGKGYPGAHIDSSNCNTNQGPIIASLRSGNVYGFGPGGGIAYRLVDSHYGGGGGYGGIGKMGGTNMTGDSGLGSVTYSNSDLMPGSGGGNGSHGGEDYGQSRDVALINGGDGGGRVSITAKNIIIQDANSKISANGTNARAGVCLDTNNVGGGGGSGGAINVQASSISVLSTKNSGSTVSGGSTDGQPGQYNISGFDNSSVPLYFTALGGLGAKNNSGTLGLGSGPGGGGGWIVVQKPTAAPNISIKKTLEPYKRDGAPAASTCSPVPAGAVNCFNPYALQVNDVIKVIIKIENLNAANAYDLYDDAFAVPSPVNKYMCKPTDLPSGLGTGISNNGSYSATNQVYWMGLDTSTTEVNYYCKVQL